MNVRAAVEAGTAPFVRVADPHTGEVGYLPIAPAIKPDSPLRHARGRPLPPRLSRNGGATA